MRLLKGKKGQVLGDLPKTAVSLFTVAITLSLLALVLLSFNQQQLNSAGTSGNNTFAFVNNSPVAVGQSNLVPGSETVWNGTVLLLPGNYTVNYAGGTITVVNQTTVWFANNLNISYQYYIGSTAKNITGYGLTANNTLASYMPTVSLVLVAVLIIGLVFTMFRRNN